jgi:hypothetical protein
MIFTKLDKDTYRRHSHGCPSHYLEVPCEHIWLVGPPAKLQAGNGFALRGASDSMSSSWSSWLTDQSHAFDLLLSS